VKPPSGALDGLVIVDKESGWTSHDVVARMRRIAGTRRVGHAGTLDPMATGVLILGVNRATRLLGYLANKSKTYEATIRLGATTITDDAEGEITAQCAPDDLARITEDLVEAELAGFRGEIKQRPSSVSAIKIGGVRSYAKVRAGEEVVLPERAITIYRLEAKVIGRSSSHIDIAATVECSSGTYIRAIARDLGSRLGVGGYLTSLRRTAIDSFTLESAKTLSELETELELMPMVDAARLTFPTRWLNQSEQQALGHGIAVAESETGDVTAAIYEDSLIALLQNSGAKAKPLAVFI